MHQVTDNTLIRFLNTYIHQNSQLGYLLNFMKKIYLAILLSCFGSIGIAIPVRPLRKLVELTPIQPSSVQPLKKLIKELERLTPVQRSTRAAMYLDTFMANGNSMLRVSQQIDSLLMEAERWNDDEMAGYLKFYDIIKTGLVARDDNKAVAIFNSATVYYEKQGDERYAGVSHYTVGQRYYVQRRYGEAFYHLAIAQKLFSKFGIQRIPDIGNYLHVMALDYYYFGYYEKVVQLMRVSISAPAFSNNLDIQRYNNLGMAYQHLNKVDSAIFFLKRTQQVADSLGSTTWVNIATGNLGTVYVKLGRYKEALPLMMKDFRYNQDKDRNPTLARNSAIQIAAAWQKLGKQDSTMHYLRESIRLNEMIKSSKYMWKQQRGEEFYSTYYQVFHDYFKAKGNTPMAYLYLDSLTHLRDESNLHYNMMTAQVAEDRLEIQQNVANLALKEVEKKTVSAHLQLLVGVTALLAIIMSLLYYLRRLRHIKDRLLAEKEKLLQQAVNEKVEAQLTEANLDLKEYMHRLLEKSTLIKIFQTQIDQLRAEPEFKTQQLDELMSRLADTKLLTADDWTDFRQRFNRAFGGLLDQLKMQYRDLTSAEERIYALEKMNVSTSQMAWMMGISQDSVRKARYRLRKRIGDIDA